jgi:hypothetical protein
MMIRIGKTRTLLYYDGPVLFVGEDLVGTNYLCLLIEKSEDRDKYICVPVSPKRLSSIILGETDLREVYENPEILNYYCLDILGSAPDDLSMSPIMQEDIDKAWYPNPGSYLLKVFEQDAREIVVKDAVVKKTAVIHLSLSPPESITEHVISTLILVKGLHLFQNMVRVAFKKAIQGLSKDIRVKLDTPDNYMTEVYAFSPGSFRIHLRAKNYADIFGRTDIERGLELIDEIVRYSDDPDKAIEWLKQNRGHVVSYYIRLLEFIIENNSPISYSWTTPYLRKVKTASIHKRQALPIYEKALTMKELGIEIIEFVGEFTKVDIEKNSWTVKRDEDETHFSGSIKEELRISLRGVTAGIQKYKFTIEEKIEESEVTGKERYFYSLIEYKKITKRQPV